MKATNIIIIAALTCFISFTSCNKDYTCTCTRTTGATTTTAVHAIPGKGYIDAKKECYNHELYANNSSPGETICKL